MKIKEAKSIKERQEMLKKHLHLNLSAVSVYPPDLQQAQFRNCENMIGAISIPLGIAGPLQINGENANGEYYIPLATTEGALVASVNRGCKVLTLSGGVNTLLEKIGITRGLIFAVSNLKEGKKLKEYLQKNHYSIEKTARQTSSHIGLKEIWTNSIGKNVFARFAFDTDEAMGMNMVTIACEKIAQYVEKETGSPCISLAGNFDIDKKQGFLNFILGRGRKVWAEGSIDKRIIKSVLKTTPEKIHKVAVKKCLVGSAISGSLGFNAHFANVIAAIFVACGQDAAHVVEGSLGITTTEIEENGNLYISVYLPDLIIGTVGGGTGLPSQQESLRILNLSQKTGKKTDSFAEVIAGAVLAGELSLLAALAERTLASSHRRFARGEIK